ncbi:unnamed protein product, partial [Rotaria sp. Silwood1]
MSSYTYSCDIENDNIAAWSISTHVLLAVHMLFVNILLTNLLIAMFRKPADPRAKVFKMIPISKGSIKDWYEYEGASTYEYAQIEAKASKAESMTSTHNINFSANEKREDTNDG